MTGPARPRLAPLRAGGLKTKIAAGRALQEMADPGTPDALWAPVALAAWRMMWGEDEIAAFLARPLPLVRAGIQAAIGAEAMIRSEGEALASAALREPG